MSATKIIKAFAKKSLTKNQGSGITSLPSEFMAAEKAAQIELLLSRAGIPLEQLDDYIRSEADLLKFLNIIEATNKPKVYSGQAAADQLNKLFPKKGEVVKFPQKRSFAEEIEAMKKSGDLVDEKDMVISDKITNRKMFKDASKRFNTKEIEEAIDNASPGFAGDRKYDAQLVADDLAEKRFGKDFYDLDQKQQMELYDEAYQGLTKQKFDPPEDLAKGGRAGYYTGGMIDVEPNLSDIGHGSDSLMARTRLVAPDSQATTSTGLNYLLAEDNDNIRVPFSAGGGGRRAFLKLMGVLGGGIAGIKTGILGLGGKETGKQVAKEVVKKAGGANEVPPYFLKLVDKIKTLGDDTMATQDKAIAKKYKDYVMEEDFAGNITIIKKNMDDPYPEEVIMSYKVDDVSLPSGKGMAKVDEYEEFTVRPDKDGKMKDIEGGVPDEVVNEGSNLEFTRFNQKADGGRIGFSPGGLANVLARLGIKGSSRRFLEKAFGKENFENMIKNDPEMHRGLLEVVEMFRNRDKEGLKMYMQKFLPHMDDATVEDFIIGSEGTEGLTGQLTRLGSGRDYAGKLEMMKKLDNVKKLENFDIKNVTKNAEGGRIGYAEKGIVDLADLESLKGLKEEGLNSEDGKFITNPRRQQARGIAALGAQGAEAGKKQKEDIKNKVIGAFTYVVDNLDQETASYVKSLFNDKLQLSYSTTMSGIKQDAFAKTGIVPIDSETIYNAIINLNLPNDVKLKMSAISDTAGDEQIKASLKSNNLGITYDSDKQEIIAQYTNVITPDGSLRITPIIAKDENSNMIKDIQIDKAFENGDLKFSINESDIFNQKNIGTKYDGENISFFAEKKQDDYGNTLDTGLTLDLPVYLLNKEEKPSVSFNLNKDLNSDFETKMFSGNFPITDNLSLFGSRKEDDSGEGNQTNYGLEYNYQKPLGERGNFFTKANIDNKGDYGFNIGLSIPFGQPEKRAPLQFSTNKPEEAYEIYKETDGFKTDPRDKRELPPRLFAEGGRIGFSGGGIFRAIIAKAAAAKGLKPYEFIKVTSYKSLPREVKMFMSADDFAKLKSGQEQMYNNYIDMMKTRKNFQQEVEAGKKTPASPIFEHMENMMEKQSYVPKTVTADDIAEAELMVKNRFQKGRKDNAQGGLQTMLGE